MSEASKSAQHTPGPWFVHGGEAKDVCVVSRSGLVTLVSRTHGDVANARLIAAAPDLLAALRIAADELEKAVARSLPLSKAHLAAQAPVVVDARAAIAKATGASS